MKKRTILIILPIIAIVLIILGIILLYKNKEITDNKIQIIDATYHSASEEANCNSLEQIYEDDKNIYYLICAKSDSVFIKYPNGTKVLAKQALEESKISIEELIKAGLNLKVENK